LRFESARNLVVSFNSKGEVAGIDMES
jgi:hypothetical protein